MQVETPLIHMLSLYLIRLRWRCIPTCEEGKEAHATPHYFFSCIWKSESLEKLSFLLNICAFVSHKKAFFKINIQRKSMFHTHSIQNAIGCEACNSSICISGVSLQKPRGKQQHVLCTHRVHARQTPRPNLNPKLFELRFGINEKTLLKWFESGRGCRFQITVFYVFDLGVWRCFVLFKIVVSFWYPTWWTKTSTGSSSGSPSRFVIDRKPKPIRTLNHLHTPSP